MMLFDGRVKPCQLGLLQLLLLDQPFLLGLGFADGFFHLGQLGLGVLQLLLGLVLVPLGLLELELSRTEFLIESPGLAELAGKVFLCLGMHVHQLLDCIKILTFREVLAGSSDLGELLLQGFDLCAAVFFFLPLSLSLLLIGVNFHGLFVSLFLEGLEGVVNLGWLRTAGIPLPCCLALLDRAEGSPLLLALGIAGLGSLRFAACAKGSPPAGLAVGTITPVPPSAHHQPSFLRP
jgi:hypothetical protein